jgi:hypothetical protein
MPEQNSFRNCGANTHKTYAEAFTNHKHKDGRCHQHKPYSNQVAPLEQSDNLSYITLGLIIISRMAD